MQRRRTAPLGRASGAARDLDWSRRIDSDLECSTGRFRTCAGRSSRMLNGREDREWSGRCVMPSIEGRSSRDPPSRRPVSTKGTSGQRDRARSERGRKESEGGRDGGSQGPGPGQTGTAGGPVQPAGLGPGRPGRLSACSSLWGRSGVVGGGCWGREGLRPALSDAVKVGEHENDGHGGGCCGAERGVEDDDADGEDGAGGLVGEAGGEAAGVVAGEEGGAEPAGGVVCAEEDE